MTILLLNQTVPANVSSDFVETFGILDSAEGLNFTETLTASDLWDMTSFISLNSTDIISTPVDSYDYSLCFGVMTCNSQPSSFTATAISSIVGEINCIAPTCSLDMGANTATVGVLSLIAGCSFIGSAAIGVSGVLAVENKAATVKMAATIDAGSIPITGLILCENQVSTLSASGIVGIVGTIDATLHAFSACAVSTVSIVATFNPTFGSYVFYSNTNENNIAAMQIVQDCNAFKMVGAISAIATMVMYNEEIALKGNINAEYY